MRLAVFYIDHYWSNNTKLNNRLANIIQNIRLISKQTPRFTQFKDIPKTEHRNIQHHYKALQKQSMMQQYVIKLYRQEYLEAGYTYTGANVAKRR